MTGHARHAGASTAANVSGSRLLATDVLQATGASCWCRSKVTLKRPIGRDTALQMASAAAQALPNSRNTSDRGEVGDYPGKDTEAEVLAIYIQAECSAGVNEKPRPDRMAGAKLADVTVSTQSSCPRCLFRAECSGGVNGMRFGLPNLKCYGN
jgi:hypothetical protein